jgi:Na+-driven multidrug efflux pump
MIIMATGAIINIVLDPIMISLMKEGNGILGAAYATITAQIIQALITLWYFVKKSDSVKINRIGIDSKLVKPVIGVGVSAMLMQVMSMVQQTIMYNTVERWGSGNWQTILGAALSLQAFAFIPLWGISQGFQPAVGVNFGAKNYERVRAFTKTFMLAATVLAVVFYAPIMIAPKTMLSMFITDESIVAEGAPMLRVLFAMYISYGVLILAITFFQAVGKGGAAALMAMLRQVALFLPLVVILPRFFSHNVEGVFYAQLITDAVVLVIGIFLMSASFKSMKSEERNERRAAIA